MTTGPVLTPIAHGELDAVGVSHLLGVLGERALDRERGAHGALGVVLVRDRRAEDGEASRRRRSCATVPSKRSTSLRS